MLTLRLLGGASLEDPRGPVVGRASQRRRLALLALLAAEHPRAVSRSKLVAYLWPESDTEQARHLLRDSLYVLRSGAGDSAIPSSGDDLRVNPECLTCDVWAFEAAIAGDDPERAVGVYAGPFLDGFYLTRADEFERWVERERQRLAHRYGQALELLAERYEARGDTGGAVEWWTRLAGVEPYNSRIAARLMRALEAAGDRAGALRQASAHETLLRAELGVGPAPEVAALAERLRAEAPNESHRPLPAIRSASTLSGRKVPTASARAVRAPTRASSYSSSAVRAWAGVSILLILAVATWKLVAGARPTSTAGVAERIIVADFRNRTTDTTYGDLVAHILRNEIARSPSLAVVGRETIAETLRRMRLDPNARLDAGVAREVAIREKVKVVVEGEVRASGRGFVVSAAVVEAATGDVIHGAADVARDSTEVLAAVKNVSNAIRRGLGESLASIRAADTLLSLTTSSLPALRKHMLGLQAFFRGDFVRSAELYDEAIADDSGFGQSYVNLAEARARAGQPRGDVVPPLVRAYRLRDRLTDRERYAVEGHYHLNVSGDVTEAIASFRKHIATLPRGEGGWYGTLGFALAATGDLAGAEEVLQEARRRFPTAVNQANLVHVLVALGKDAEARRVLAEMSRRLPEHPLALRLRVAFLTDSGRYEEAHALAARIRSDAGIEHDLRAQAELDAVRGRFDEALTHLRALREQLLARRALGPALEVAADAARLGLLCGESDTASEVDRLLARHQLDSLHVLSRPYLPLARFYADAGRPRRARTWLDRYEREVPSEFAGPDKWMLHRTRAATLRAEGRLAAALAELRQAARVPALRTGGFGEPATAVHAEMARLYDALGSADSAIAAYERYLAVHSLGRGATDAFELPIALERLGALYENRGDRDRAAAQYRRLAALWRDADLVVQPRVTAARRRAAALDRRAAGDQVEMR